MPWFLFALQSSAENKTNLIQASRPGLLHTIELNRHYKQSTVNNRKPPRLLLLPQRDPPFCLNNEGDFRSYLLTSYSCPPLFCGQPVNFPSFTDGLSQLRLPRQVACYQLANWSKLHACNLLCTLPSKSGAQGTLFHFFNLSPAFSKEVIHIFMGSSCMVAYFKVEWL